MTFTDALSAVFDNSDRVTRRVWNNRRANCFLDEGKLCTTWNSQQQMVDDQPHPWVISEQDFYSDDWEILSDG
jgi:hypothetical protein